MRRLLKKRMKQPYLTKCPEKVIGSLNTTLLNLDPTHNFFKIWFDKWIPFILPYLKTPLISFMGEKSGGGFMYTFINVSYVMDFLAWWVLKTKVFTQKSTVVKWNCCIFWIDIAWGLQKLGLILESKVVQKLSLEKNVFNKKWSPKLIFLDEFFFRKNSVDFWHRKLALKVQFWRFLRTWH